MIGMASSFAWLPWSLIKCIRCRILRLYIFKKVNDSVTVSADLDVKTMTFGKKGWGSRSDPYP